MVPASQWRHRVTLTASRLFQRAWLNWRAPEQMTAREWADKYLYLSPDAGSARPGKYSSLVTPWLMAIQDAIDDPAVTEVVCMKSSQIGWTMGVVLSYIGKRIDVDPCPIVVMFPTTDAAREFNDEKFTPTVDVTPQLQRKIDQRSRKSGNRATFKKFAGGFLKLVGSNSPRSVKSSSAPVLIIEEPDDASSNVKGQGDSITLLGDRAKTFPRYKKVMGGTPTIDGLSAIQAAEKKSDRRRLFVPCHHCGEEHVLAWENVKWDEAADIAHEIYGRAQPNTAAYYCPHCGGQWSDYDKNENVRRACAEKRWRATAPFNGIAGFGHLSELYAHWPKSAFSYLVRRYLEAKHEADQGDDSKLIAFHNSTLGIAYVYGGKQLDAEALRERADDYADGVVPKGGLLLTVGVDTQHDRFAIATRAWGRGEESWLVDFREIYATTGVNDRADLVWQELEQRVFGPYKHECGREMYATAVSIDSSDGATSDAVYDWVRVMRKKYPHVQVMPIKGASDNVDKEIFSLPKPSVDHRTPTKAAKYGLRVFIVGTNKAKDLILGGDRQGRIHLTGDGPGRFHFPKSARIDYFDQLISEVKAPSRRLRGRLVWQLRSGRRNEALDCEVYALHAARSRKTHILTPAHWDVLEQRLLQSDLFTIAEGASSDEPADADAPNQEAPAAPAPAAKPMPAPPPPPRPAPKAPRKVGAGNWVNSWRR